MQSMTFCAAFFLAGCTEQEILYDGDREDTGDGNLHPVSLTLSGAPVCVIGEKAESSDTAQPRSSHTEVAEGAIEDVWVFQYDAQGNQLSAPHYYTIQASHDFKVMLHAAENCTLCFVANTGNEKWGVAGELNTLSKFRAKTLSYNTESDVYGGSRKRLIMVKELPGVSVKGDDTQNSLDVTLERLMARLDFSYVFSGSALDNQGKPLLEIVDVTLRNVPNSSALKAPGSTGGSIIPLSYASVQPSQNETTIWYVPENLQGTTSNNNQATKNDNAPLHAMHIQLTVQSLADGSKYVYTVYPGENTVNDFNIRRNTSYKVNVNISSTKTDNRVSAEPANCFVMKRNSSIFFDPYTRKETGGGWKYSDYVNAGDAKKQVRSVKVLWQTGDGKGNYAIGNNSKGNLVYMHGNRIYVQSGAANGNAVIAGYNGPDGTGDIVWSWHIWVNDNQPALVSKAIPYTTYEWDQNGIKSEDPNKRVSGPAVMVCNLGSININLNLSSPALSYGLLYQWGRKDPFPQNKIALKELGSPYSSEHIVAVYDNEIKQIPMSETPTTKELFQAVMTSEKVGNIEYTLHHPTHFLISASKSNYINEGDWYWGHNDKLWGGIPYSEATKKFETTTPHSILLADNGAAEKSIFDPCPSGWMLAPGDMWLGFTKNGYNVETDPQLALINCSETIQAPPQYGYHIHMKGWKSGVTTFFPTQGLRVPTGELRQLGICGNYHTSSSSKDGKVYIFHLHIQPKYYLVRTFETDYAYSRRSTGGPIRCVREEIDN